MTKKQLHVKQPFYIILLLIVAGEAVFILRFVLARVFRPTFLDVFQLTNLELGTCFSVYGIIAFVSYLFGGPYADRFPPRKLMAIAEKFYNLNFERDFKITLLLIFSVSV